MNVRLACAAAAVVGLCVHAAAMAQDPAYEMLEVVDVTAAPVEPAVQYIEPAELSPARDTAESLRDIPGVSGSRIGGHGTDPVIRGLGQNRVNVLIDGAYVHGGCPNRMDPPTAYAPAAGFEAITVIKGVSSLEYGGGGPGGTILFERITPAFDAAAPVRGGVDAGYRHNGNGRDLAADVAVGGERGYLRLLASHKAMDDYDDGGGRSVRSSFSEDAGALVLGYTPNADTWLELSLDRQRTTDLLFAGTGMDSPSADNDTLRLKFETSATGEIIDLLRAEIYDSRVDHVMDNYSLRTPANPMMLMRAPSSSDTRGGRLVAELAAGSGNWKFGADVQDNRRNAVRVNDFNGSLNSVLWPGVEIDQRGLFAEYARGLDSVRRLVLGLRYDRVAASASRAGIDPAGMPLSPNALYAIYYNGAQAQDRTEHNWSGLLRVEQDLQALPGTLFAGLSRSVRTADATERFLASNGATPDDRWVGNPAIKPEKHHQLEAGISLGREAWDLQATVYYNRVQDYILRDRFHQAGNNATVYRNVSASLVGGEIAVGWRWSPAWRAEIGLAQVRAHNETDDRAIAQTPPLEMLAGLHYTRDRWDAGLRVRAAARQQRVDTDSVTGSGLDTGEGSAWAVMDLVGRYRVREDVHVELGVDNLFDREYAQHLNRASAFDPQQVQVNEPGASGWLKLSASF